MDCCHKDACLPQETVRALKWVLYVVFAINASMFIVELVSGIRAGSNALIADSLDMLGDAFVYGLSLFVLAKSNKIQAKASIVKGAVMLALGLYVFWETYSKLINPAVPHAQTITIIGIIALLANVLCFYLLTRHKDKNINMKSAWVCSRNDLYANVSVIAAGLLVGYFNSMWPDILVGIGIAGMVIYFSLQVIKESIKHTA